jgi:hypothetical protein
MPSVAHHLSGGLQKAKRNQQPTTSNQQLTTKMDKDVRHILIIVANFVAIGFAILFFTKGCG